MKLENYEPAAITSVESNKFGVKMDAKMYSILTDKLYTNKEGAIIRELSANALDAHRAAGKEDVPFLITLPTWLDKNFAIRDYGTGIDPDKFEEVYTTLGNSTKDDENNSIGAFGLGSKTPFTKVESYTIENFYKGNCYVYTAFKDKGYPSISLVGSKETTEQDGLKISFSFSDGYVEDFLHEVEKQLRFYEVKPKILGGTRKIEWKQEPSLEDGWYINTKNLQRQTTVIMGGIPYIIDDFKDLPNELYEEKVALGGNCELLIKADIGEVDIPPSRESLEMSSKSKEFLKRMFAKIKVEYVTKFFSDMGKSKNLKEAHQVYTRMKHSLLEDALKNPKGVVGDILLVTAFGHIQCNELIEGRQDLIELREIQYKSNRRYHNSNGGLQIDKPCWLNLARIFSREYVYINDIGRGANTLIKEQVKLKDNDRILLTKEQLRTD